MKWYEESPGVSSSKRLWGGALLAVGIIMKIVVFVGALTWGVPNGDLAGAQADGFLWAGSTLLGITGLDVFKRG